MKDASLPSSPGGFFEELQRRKVYRVAIAYIAVAGFVIQIGSAVFPAWDWPLWAFRFVVVALLAGFPVVLILAWAYDVTSDGIKVTPAAAGSPWRRSLAILLTAGAVISLVAGFFLWPRGASAGAGKSIAVLPFDNFSDDKQASYFADGVQDDILTALSKISDLKVISRSSVMRYRDKDRNLSQIGHELNVVYLLEGSVRRAGEEVRVTAQLIDSRTDAHIWAENYDRKMSDVFTIQSQIAQNIVTALRATLSPTEKEAIALRPTEDMEAYDLFLKGKELVQTFNDTPDRKETLLRAIRFLDEAIAHDRKFALAYCWAAIAHDNLYWFGLDHSPKRLALAESCVRQALDLAPDLGEAHLAQALVFYHGYRDYTQARQHLEIARRSLPNNASLYSLAGYIDRREGRWAESLQNLQRAAELDPRNFKVLSDLSVLYDLLRRYDDKEQLVDRAIAINPAQAEYWQMIRAATELEKGDLAKAHQLADNLPVQYDPDGAATGLRVLILLYERSGEEAHAVLGACKNDELVDMTGSLVPRGFLDGQISRALGNLTEASTAFDTARQRIEQKLRDNPDDGLLYGILCLIDAGLGRKEQALAEGRRAVELRPISKDAVDGPVILTRLAMTYAWLGERDQALEQLALLAKTPGGPDYGQLKFDPSWDTLRGDPRFVRIIDELQPRPQAH